MKTMFQWILMGLLATFFVMVIMFRGMMQNAIVYATETTDPVTGVSHIGTLRGAIGYDGDWVTLDGNGNISKGAGGTSIQAPTLDKDELVANLYLDIAREQLNTGNDITIGYDFIDSNGNKTTEDLKIRGIAYHVTQSREKSDTKLTDGPLGSTNKTFLQDLWLESR